MITDAVYITAWLTSLLFFCSRANFGKWIPAWPTSQRLLDVAGVFSLWIHILTAYGLAHDWSHQAATEHVAERTHDMLGIRSGLGIYANFVVAIVWTLLAFGWQTSSPDATNSPSHGWRVVVRIGLEIFLWLMFLSATILFARPLSAAAFSVIALLTVATRLTAGDRKSR